MSLLQQLRAYPAHADPVTAACNRIALLVASSQPLYPLYVLWIVGGDWQVTVLTYLSTPLFAAVPAVANRNMLAGRALLPLAGICNSSLSAKVFGTASGVEWFLVSCLLIIVLAFSQTLTIMLALLALVLAAALLHGHYGLPVGHFTADEYTRFFRLNIYSVVVLSGVVLWTLLRARRSRRA